MFNFFKKYGYNISLTALFLSLIILPLVNFGATNIGVTVTDSGSSSSSSSSSSSGGSSSSSSSSGGSSSSSSSSGGDDGEGILGCMDSEAKNFNESATVDDGSCVFSIVGCMDPEANNYNKDAETGNQQSLCIYNEAVPNVSDFQRAYSEGVVELTWENPPYAKLDQIILVKSSISTPTSPDEGTVIYSGKGESYSDIDVEIKSNYYYTIFVKSNEGNYSSGVTTFIYIPSDNGNKNDDDDDDGGGGGSTTTGPFDFFEPSGILDIFLPMINDRDFAFWFLQSGEASKGFDAGSEIVINGRKETLIRVAYEEMPEVLKTIGVTISKGGSSNTSQSYLMKINKEMTAYEALVPAFTEGGDYKVSIYIISYNNKSIKKYDGRLIVRGSDEFNKVVKNVAAPVAVTTGAVLGLGQLLYTTTGMSSFFDLYLLLIRQLGVLLGFFGLKRKHKPWGTVYDSVTKRPLDPAYVVVKQGKKEFTSAITDLDGRYGFFLPTGQYDLEAQKTHYKFPSQVLAGKTQDELYNNLYFGGSVTPVEGEVVNLNIPLDPIGFDWNEYAKDKASYFRLHSRRELLRARISNIFYGIGLIAAIAYLVWAPSWFNIIVALGYISIMVGERIWRFKHKVVSARVGAGGDPLPYAVIKVFFAGLDQEAKRLVADQLGRFYVLVGPGTYYFTVEEKLSDGSYQLVHKTEPMELKKGVLEKDIIIPEKVEPILPAHQSGSSESSASVVSENSNVQPEK